MTPLELLLSKLPGARKSGSGWSARCPAHDDRHASLSVSAGDDGTVLLKCHAGCDTAAIVAALGLGLADLFPAKPAVPRATSGGRAYPTANAAVAALERQHGRRSALWTYHDAAGEPVGLVVRWDKSGDKEIRPVARFADGWRIKAMPEPRPLYGLPDLAATKTVLVVEGERCADAALTLRFAATTSVGGSQAANKTDWKPLAGKDVWILPDNDEPGRKYAETVASIITTLKPVPVVRIIGLPGLPDRGDIVDWIDGHGDAAEPDGMRAEIEALAQAVQPWRPAASSTESRSRWEPDLVCLADVTPQAVPWLWHGRIPLGRITLLVGRPGCGKSLVTCDLAARISTRNHWPNPGFDRAPLGDTLLICAEDGVEDTIRPRLDAAGANCRRVHLLKAAKVIEVDGNERSVAFDLSNVDLIRDALARLPECKLVVVDPIGSYLGGRVDAHRDNEVRSVLAPLAALAAERGVAVVLVCHTRKALASFADDMALGSRAFVGLARSVLHLTADEDDRDRKLLLPGKCNLSASPPGLAFRIVGEPARVEWEPEPLEGFHADDAMIPGDKEVPRGPAPKTRDAASDWLADLLKDGPMAVDEIKIQAKDAGLAWRTVRRANEVLGIVARKRTFAGGWEWALPEGVHPDAEDGHDPRRRPSDAKLGRLRQNAGENVQNSLDFIEGGQVTDNLAAFDDGAENLVAFDGEAPAFPFGWNNPDDPDGDKQPR
jgi:hypothetical protein